MRNGIWISAAASLILAVGAYAYARVLLLRLPTDFLRGARMPGHPVVRTIIGVVLMLVGIALLFLPGPGIVLILIGLVLAEIPGRDRLVRRLIERNRVLEYINSFRGRQGVPPIEHSSSEC